MDTPLAAAVHKENVHIGGGKATVTMKPDKLKTAKTAGKERKALADLSATQKHPVTRLSKGANLNSKLGLLGNFGKGSTPSDHALTDEEIKQCYEWAKDGIEEMGGYSWSTKDEAKLVMNQTLSDHALTDEEIKQCYEWAKEGIEEMGGYSWSTKDEAKLVMNQTLSEIMASAIGVSISELEQPSSDEEGYETDESVFNNSISFSAYCVLVDDACLHSNAIVKIYWASFSSLCTRRARRSSRCSWNSSGRVPIARIEAG